MKLHLRILTLFLTLVLALSTFAFVGCQQVEEETTVDYEEEEEEGEDYFPDIEKKDYASDFYMYLMEATCVPTFFIVDESDGSPMQEAVYNRQEKIKRYIGVNVVRVQRPKSMAENAYTQLAESAIKNMDGTLDCLVTHCNIGVSRLITENYLQDIGELKGIDLDAEYWNQEFMDTVELNGNYFLGFSDFNVLYTFVLAFNKNLLAKYESKLDKSVYDLVKDYEWTLDEMISLASLVELDATGDGKTLDDTYGFSAMGWFDFCQILQSCDVNLMEQDESGIYKCALSSSRNMARTQTIIEKLQAFSKSNSALVEFNVDGKRVSITTNRVLMTTQASTHLPNLLDYSIEFGVLPFPMFDTDQASVGYRALSWGGYIGVLSYLGDEAHQLMVGETLELLAFYSENVKITFYEKLLGKQVADVPEDAAMLEIIWDSVCADVGLTFQDTVGTYSGLVYVVCEIAQPNSKYGGLASFLASNENKANVGFKKFIDGIK
jgi:hypothetical protein